MTSDSMPCPRERTDDAKIRVLDDEATTTASEGFEQEELRDGKCLQFAEPQANQVETSEAQVRKDNKARRPRVTSFELQQLKEPEFWVDVKPNAPEVRQNPDAMRILDHARELSQECFFSDCLEGCSKRGGWHITLMVAGSPDGVKESQLLGFLVYRLKPELGNFCVAKLAVPEVHRRRGFGRQLMLWAANKAKEDRQLSCMSLSALPQAVPFYKRLGFKQLHMITEQDDESALFPGQVYMELRTPTKAKVKQNKPGVRPGSRP